MTLKHMYYYLPQPRTLPVLSPIFPPIFTGGASLAE
jgi:hypothetical protein